MKLTLVIRKGTTHFIGQIKEIPGVLTQGQTVEEVKENITDALALYLEDIREDNSGDMSGIISQEKLEFA